MHVAGPINNPDEARMLEQAAYLTDLRSRTHPVRRKAATATSPVAPARPSLFPY